MEDLVKENIHPNYRATTFTCSCGNVIETYSTVADQHIEICDKCHPFYTGKEKLIDTAGRVDRFFARYGKDKA
jgi:large subunit ribosomal protein L31